MLNRKPVLRGRVSSDLVASLASEWRPQGGRLTRKIHGRRLARKPIVDTTREALMAADDVPVQKERDAGGNNVWPAGLGGLSRPFDWNSGESG